MVKHNLQSLALKLTAAESTEEEKIEKLYHYVKEKIKYKITIIGDPEEILKLGYGSCIDNALLFSELLKSIGIKSRYHAILVDSNLLLRFSLTKFIPSRLRPPFFPHIFNEVYSGGRWEKLDTSFDSEIEKYFLQIKFASGEKECCIPPEYILKDLGAFNSFSDIFAAPSFLQLVDEFLPHKKEIQLSLNLSNRFLYQKRKNKTEGLKEKEAIENILININRLKRK